MDFIIETYTTSFQPKLDDDGYCYYVDDTNWNIMMLAVRDYEKHILRMPEENILRVVKALEARLADGPIFVFFEHGRVSYDELNCYPNINCSYAANKDYDVIKVNVHKVLMTVD